MKHVISYFYRDSYLSIIEKKIERIVCRIKTEMTILVTDDCGRSWSGF